MQAKLSPRISRILVRTLTICAVATLFTSLRTTPKVNIGTAVTVSNPRAGAAARTAETVRYQDTKLELVEVYRVIDGELDAAALPEYRRIWTLAEDTLPAEALAHIRQLNIVTDGPARTLAMVHRSTNERDSWILSMDPAESHDVLQRTLVHELAHLYTLGEADLTSQRANCAGELIQIGCARPQSPLADYAERFWLGSLGAGALFVGRVRHPVRRRQRARRLGGDLHVLGLRRKAGIERHRGEISVVREQQHVRGRPRRNPGQAPPPIAQSLGPTQETTQANDRGAEVPMERVRRRVDNPHSERSRGPHPTVFVVVPAIDPARSARSPADPAHRNHSGAPRGCGAALVRRLPATPRRCELGGGRGHPHRAGRAPRSVDVPPRIGTDACHGPHPARVGRRFTRNNPCATGFRHRRDAARQPGRDRSTPR